MIKLTKDEVNTLLQIVDENLCPRDKYITLTKEMIEENWEYDGEEVLLSLNGYKVKQKQKGDHKNDGQIVDYKFTFKSSTGEKTRLWTPMCLVVGWNYANDFEIK
jgi:hypothetical protein